jgi:hypothetical protein
MATYRRMKITLENGTDVLLVRNSAKLTHGKWIGGVEPAVKIQPGGNGHIDSEKQTGASYGTEGDCAYVIVEQGTSQLEIHWDKPLGSGRSEVTAKATPPYVASVRTTVETSEDFAATVKVTGQEDRKKHISNWMTENWDLLGNKKLNRICVPGSHDSGTFQTTSATNYSSERNTRTQLGNIEQQLQQGIRYFDLRPALYKDDFYTAHYSYIPTLDLHYQGAIGVSLKEAFDQIRSFVGKPQNENELIILDFSHFIDWDHRDDHPNFDSSLMERFETFIQTHLGAVLVRGKVDDDLANEVLNDLIHGAGAGRRNVIARSDDFARTAESARAGLWSAFSLGTSGGYSNTNDPAKMKSDQLSQLTLAPHSKGSGLFQLCWQLTLDASQNVAPTASSILDLANKANPDLYPTVTEWMSRKYIDGDTFPNIINTDFCDEAKTKAVELSLSICNSVNH